MGYFIVLFLSALSVLLIIWALKNKFVINQSSKYKSKQSPKEKTTPCPLCNSMLYQGENLITRIYGDLKEKEQRATIHGCPYCFPTPTLAVKRVCPVCHQTVPVSGHLDAFLFIRDTGKRHIHITGCTECHKRNKR